MQPTTQSLHDLPHRRPQATPRSRRTGRDRAAYWFLLPYATLTLLFLIYPLVSAFLLAFYQTNGPRTRVFVGLDNFVYLLSDPVFLTALGNTSIFALCSLLVQLPLSMGLALLLNRSKDKSRSLFRLILFSPNLVGQLFVGILFSVLFAPRFGLINRGLQALLGWGLEERWLSDPALVMPALVLSSLWMYVGFNMIYFLAALQGVDKNLEDAARIDGANALQVFWHVTLPSMRHVLIFVVIMSLIGSYQLFELPLAMLPSTNGFGPNNSGVTLITYLNQVAFNEGDLGLGSAVGWIVTLVIFLISLVQIRISGVGRA